MTPRDIVSHSLRFRDTKTTVGVAFGFMAPPTAELAPLAVAAEFELLPDAPF